MALFSAFRKLRANKPLMERRTTILIRDKRTHLYYTAAGSWTPDPSKAMAFDDFLRAVLFSNNSQLTNAEVVLQTDKGESIFAVGNIAPSGHRHD